MKQIEVAAKEMGVILGGDGKGHEAPVPSDQRLQTRHHLASTDPARAAPESPKACG